MASGLLRNPKVGRVWYPPARVEIPRGVDRAELVNRLYGEGGPKHGLRERSDAIETLCRGYTYLRLRAQLEESGDFATTAEQTIVGLAFELTRRGAKAWDPALARGLERNARREELLRRRGSALTKLLDELAGAGLLVWGGERDNKGMWWRLRIRLLDPDAEGPPAWEPWMRGVEPPDGEPDGSRDGGGGNGEGTPDSQRRPVATVDLASLYGRVEALTGHRPRLEARQVVQLRSAVKRFAAHAAHRPRGTPGEALEVLLALIEHHAPRDEGALARAVARFDGYSRQVKARGRASVSSAAQAPPARAGGSPDSSNCAALFNQHSGSNRSVGQALACRTGARPSEDHMRDVELSADAGEGPGKDQQRTEGEGSGTGPVDDEALLARVAARHAALQALSPASRAHEAETAARARRWPPETPLPVGLLTAAAQALGREHSRRPWLTDRQVDRLRRAERRYTRYADQRPAGSPPPPAAALIGLVEHAPREVRHPLPWAIAQLDLLTKRMRRAHRRETAAERLPAARRRSDRRRERRAPAAKAWFRRAGRERQGEIDQRVANLADTLLARRLEGTLRYALLRLEDELRDEDGIATTGPQLQQALRDELHHRRTGVWDLSELDGATHAAPAPGTFDPHRPQLTGEDRAGLQDRRWLTRRQASLAADGVRFGVPAA